MTTNPEGLREQIAAIVALASDPSTSSISIWEAADAIISGPLQARVEELEGETEQLRGYLQANYRTGIALEARVEELEGAVRIAAVTFRQYEALHLAKGTQDGDEKAHRNHELAAHMEAALSHKEGEGNV